MEEYEEDGYEDYEDYDDYGEQGYAQAEEEEDYEEKPSAEAQEYLELRARIKEQIRKKMQKENGSSATKSQEMKRKSTDNYGSFFGPSQPVIAQRVIQESKTLLENPHMIFKSSNPSKKASSSTGTSLKNGTHEKVPKVRTELKSKLQKIKDTRDYSFLLSDDAELPTAARPPASQNASASKYDPRSSMTPHKSKQPTGDSARYTHSNGHVLPKSGVHGSASTSRPSTSFDSRVHRQNNGTGPGRPLLSMDSRRQLQSKDTTRPARPLESRSQSQSSNGTGPGRPVSSIDSRRQKQVINGTGPGRPVVPMERRRPLESNGTGPGRPIGGSKGGTSQAPLSTGQKKAPAPPGKAILPPTRKPLPPRMHSSVPEQVERKRVLQDPKKILRRPEHSVASYKSQISKPIKPSPPRPSVQDNQLKRKSSSRPFADEDEDEDPLQMIRKMFKVDRYRNRVDDDDDDIEEAHFDDILEEERYSAKIARKEDEEQLRLIQEEERLEEERRMRKLAKKRKLSHH